MAPPPRVTLGPVGDRSLTPAVFGLFERGVTLRPHLAADIRGTVRIVFAEPYPPVLIACAPATIDLRDDVDAGVVDLEAAAALADFVLLIASPLTAGVPKPTTRTGRSALARWVDGRVDFTGSLALARKLLALTSVASP